MGGISTNLKAGLAFCTRLPVTVLDGTRLADAAWTLAPAGAVVGLIGGLGAALVVDRRRRTRAIYDTTDIATVPTAAHTAVHGHTSQG